MSGAAFKVFIVDDDPGVLKALARLVRSAGHEVETFATPHAFIAGYDPAGASGCILLDVAMPGLNGLRLQEAIAAGRHPLPVIFITGRGDIPTSVRAMKAGAVDFLTKPVNDEDLLAALARVQEQEARDQSRRTELGALRQRLASLTPREREVLGHVVTGRLNKQIAADLGTVEKTIKVHRARMMAKMGVRSVAQLVVVAQKVGISSDGQPAGGE
jgi:FixJ family two-component response regulator